MTTSLPIPLVFFGSFIHSLPTKKIVVEENTYIGVASDGRLAFIEKSLDKIKEHFIIVEEKIIALGRKFLIPGFIDTHFHAPQYSFAGTGILLPLLEWLEKYTFPTEAQYSNLNYARDVYQKAVNRTLKNGSTTVCYHTTIHLEACKALVDIVIKSGQRAFIGKLSMDRNSPDFYIETTEQSLKESEAFVQYVLDTKSDLITPTVTPRFAVTCSDALMTGLGQLAKKYSIPVQTHSNENLSEIALIENELYPGKTYIQVYDEMELLTPKSIVAHCVHLKDSEIEILKKTNAKIAHCPLSNLAMKSGYCPVRFLDSKGLKIGLGTDVSGGISASMLSSVRHCLFNSIFFSGSIPPKGDQFLELQEAFYYATLGGSYVIGMQDKLGNFEVGKFFDALVIDPSVAGSPFDVFDRDSLFGIFEKFLMLGDDRNIVQIYINGKEVHL